MQGLETETAPIPSPIRTENAWSPSLMMLLMNRQNPKDNSLSFFVWNVQGAAKKEFLLTLKELLHKHDPKALALVETKTPIHLALRLNQIEALKDAQSNWLWDDEGIKSMARDFFLSLFSNDTFMTKLQWRLMNEKDSLWSRVVHTKYCNGRCDIDMFHSKREASNLGQGARAKVGNGKKILFWFPSWACDKPLSNLVTNLLHPDIQDATVEELWHENEGWKWHLVDELTLKKIASISVNSNEPKDDCLAWDPTGNNTCLINSVISFIREEDNGIDDPI
ncbi:hypothetical protein Cgig2_018120 [Carnegiea gigantea]|uniref:Uncharacterized protein n=1 Tax=Carnegiea gigantea TaxID=171969 RepID=A0A9Q1GS34_9CARY|nr:hypothetical protein Cgig2_018120 [Carnegiea gigantea]